MSKTLKFSLVINLVLIVALVYLSKVGIRKEYLYVDVDRILTQEREYLVSTNLSDEQMAKQRNKFKERFQQGLKRLEKDYVVLSSPKAIAGAKDVTDEFYATIKTRQKND